MNRRVISAQALRLLVNSAPYLLPIAYFLLIVCLQPANQLGDTFHPKKLSHFFYDDTDWVAIALRTLNSERGRIPGASHDPCAISPGAPLVIDPDAPIRTQCFLEYPNPVVWFFRGALTFVPSMKDREIPASILDGCQSSIVAHLPENQNERAIWSGFRRLIQIYEFLMLLCLLGLIATLQRGYGFGTQLAAPAILLVLPAFVYFSLARFDILPELLTALAIAYFSHRRIALSSLLLAVAAMVKIYPILLAPLFIRHLLPDRRQALKWTLMFGATIAAILAVTILNVGLPGTLAPFRFQLSRDLEALSIYGAIVPRVLGTQDWKLLRLGILVLVVGFSVWTPIRGLGSLLRRSAVILITFINLQVFFSPQWIVWLSPFLFPLARGNRSLTACLIAFDVTMFLSFPVMYFQPQMPGHGLILYLRFALSGFLVYLLLAQEWSSDVHNETPAMSALESKFDEA